MKLLSLLGRIARRFHLRRYAAALITFFAASLIQLRFLVSSGIGIAAPPIHIVLQEFPVFPLVAPNIAEQWILSPQTIIAAFLLPLHGSSVDVYVIQYVFLIALEGIFFFLYSRRVLSRLLNSDSERITLAALVGGLLYESQNLFNIGNLYWIANLTTYATIPLLMYLVERMTLVPTFRRAIPWMVASAFPASYLLVEDAHSVLVIPLATLLSLAITQTTVPGSRMLRGLLRAIISTSYAIALGAPSIGFLLNQHLFGNESYYYGGKTAAQLSSGWASASQPLWLLLDNNWFNRDVIFRALYPPGGVQVVLIALFGALCTVIALSALVLAATPRQRKFNLLIGIVLLLTIGSYMVTGLWPSPVYDLLSAQNLLAHLLQEGLIPDTLISLCLSLLVAETLSLFLSGGLSQTEEGARPMSSFSAFEGPTQSSSAPTYGLRAFRPASTPALGVRSRRDRVVSYLVVGITLVATVGQAASAYVSAAGPTSEGGNLLPQDPSLLSSIGPIATYVDQHATGRVIWIPGPIYLGAGNAIVPSQYPYPDGSDGPFSSEYFNYLFGPGSTSLEMQRDWAALARASADIGVQYAIAWGNTGLVTAQEMSASGEFQIVTEDRGAILLMNRDYTGLAFATPTAAVIQGGLSAYASSYPFLSALYQNYTPIPYYVDIPPIPSEALSDPRTLFITTNYSQLELSLAIQLVGSNYQLSPFSNVSNNQPAQGWSGGDTSDAGGFPWSGWVQNQPGYSWESSYGINTGYVYTATPNETLRFRLSTPQLGIDKLLLRALVSSTRNSSFVLDVGGHNFSISIPVSSQAHFDWIVIGNVDATSRWTSVTLTSLLGGAINLIEAVPLSAWDTSITAAGQRLNDTASLLVPPTAQDGSNPVELPNGTDYEIVLPDQPSWSVRIHGLNTSLIAVRNSTGITVSNYNGSVPVLGLSKGHDINLTTDYAKPAHVGFTVSIWFRWSGSGDQTEVLAGDWGYGTSYNWVLSVQRPDLLVWTAGGSTWVNSVYAGIRPNVWYFATGEFSNNTTCLYLNGTLAQSEQHMTNVTAGSNWTVGYLPQTGGGPADNYSGLMGSIVTFPTFLNQSDITQLYIGSELNSGLESSARGFVSIGTLAPIGNTKIVNASMESNLWITDQVVDVPLALLYLVALEHPSNVLPPSSKTLGSIQLGPGRYEVSYTPGELTGVAFGRQTSDLGLAQPTDLSYSTTSSPMGPEVNQVDLQVPTADIGQPVYVSVSGNGGELIQPGSEASMNGTMIPAVPAFGVTEGFVVPGPEASSRLKLTLQWYDTSSVNTANAIAYAGFVAGLVAFTFAILRPGPATRPPKTGALRGLTQYRTILAKAGRRVLAGLRRERARDPCQ